MKKILARYNTQDNCGDQVKRKLIIILSVVFILFMTGLFIFYLIKEDSSRWQVAVGGIAVSALPLLLLFLKNNPFNILIVLGYFLFIFCTTFLGSIASFYLHFKWWDSTLHFYKGILVGCIGIALFKVFIPKHVRPGLSRWILFLFTLSLAMTASVLWEVYEFVGDQFLTHTMQRGGNTDTMLDLLFGMSGGLLVAIYISVKRKNLI